MWVCQYIIICSCGGKPENFFWLLDLIEISWERVGNMRFLPFFCFRMVGYIFEICIYDYTKLLDIFQTECTHFVEHEPSKLATSPRWKITNLPAFGQLLVGKSGAIQRILCGMERHLNESLGWKCYGNEPVTCLSILQGLFLVVKGLKFQSLGGSRERYHG